MKTPIAVKYCFGVLILLVLSSCSAKQRIRYVTTLPAMITAFVWPMPRGNPCEHVMMAMSDKKNYCIPVAICAGVDLCVFLR